MCNCSVFTDRDLKQIFNSVLHAESRQQYSNCQIGTQQYLHCKFACHISMRAAMRVCTCEYMMLSSQFMSVYFHAVKKMQTRPPCNANNMNHMSAICKQYMKLDMKLGDGGGEGKEKNIK